MSRTPVREALFRLEREGYLEVHAKSGWSVRALDFDGLDHLYDLRLVLECEAVRKLCAGDPRVALAGLEKIWLVAPRQRLTDGARVARLDEEFHAKLVAAAGNPELARLHQTITERIRIVRRLDFTHPERVDLHLYRAWPDPARHPRAQAGEGHRAAARAHRGEQVRGAQDQPAPAAPRAPRFEG